MIRILVCDLCGDVLAVGDAIVSGSHEVEGTNHGAAMLLETDEQPPADATPEEILAWGLTAAGDADEVDA